MLVCEASLLTFRVVGPVSYTTVFTCSSSDMRRGIRTTSLQPGDIRTTSVAEKVGWPSETRGEIKCGFGKNVVDAFRDCWPYR